MLLRLESDDRTTTTLRKETHNNTTTKKLKNNKSIVFYNTEWPSAVLHQEQHEVGNATNAHKNTTKTCHKNHPNSKVIFQSIVVRFSYPNASQNAPKIHQKFILNGSSKAMPIFFLLESILAPFWPPNLGACWPYVGQKASLIHTLKTTPRKGLLLSRPATPGILRKPPWGPLNTANQTVKSTQT